MAKYYPDFQSYLKHLENENLLQRIRRPINKDTEMHPLVRIQFRGLPESARKGFLFEQVIDSRGNKYDIPVAVGCIAASRQVYLQGMQCRDEEELTSRWTWAQAGLGSDLLILTILPLSDIGLAWLVALVCLLRVYSTT